MQGGFNLIKIICHQDLLNFPLKKYVFNLIKNNDTTP